MKYLLSLLLVPMFAFANGEGNGNNNGPGDDVIVDSYNTQNFDNDNSTNADAEGGNASVVVNIDNGASSEEGGSAGVQNANSGGGDTYTTSNESNMFALSLGFPNAVGCFGGVEGGGSGSGVGGFLGFHKLNVACWMNQLAESERSLPIRARLKCGDKHFRNAITFDVKGNKIEETQACIDFVTPEWEKEIAAERAALAGFSSQCGSENDVCSYVNGELRHEVTP